MHGFFFYKNFKKKFFHLFFLKFNTRLSVKNEEDCCFLKK